MKFFEKLFHIKENNSSLKNEIIGGILTFIAMCYILPVNASILHDMGMNHAGVFAMTALLSSVFCIAMGLIANYPIALSTAMGLNAFLAYTLSDSLGFTHWQEKMILLTVAGILTFIVSLTPFRKMLIEGISKELRSVISLCLGGFILFVGLKGSGIIVSDATNLVKLGSFANPGMLVGFISVILALVLTFSRKKFLSVMAMPIAILVAAVLGLTISIIMIHNNAIIINEVDEQLVYSYNTGIEAIDSCAVNLPIPTWVSHPTWGVNGIDKVFMYGLFEKGGSYTGENFVNDLGYIFTRPASYVGIFSLVFVNIFGSTATLIAIGDKCGYIDENGKMKNFRRVVLTDSAGALVCAPLGTSTITSFVECTVGVSMGARTGFASIITGFLFLLSAFIYPVFSIFSAGSVTSAALTTVGALIVMTGITHINKKDVITCFTALFAFMFSILTYSISNGIGVGFIVYVLLMLISGRRKDIKAPEYAVAILFIAAFASSTIIELL